MQWVRRRRVALNTFGANRRLELLSGRRDPGPCFAQRFGGSSLQIGRQFVHGAEIAALDGASFTNPSAKVLAHAVRGAALHLLFGSGTSAIGGANIAFRLPGNSMVEYQTLFYVRVKPQSGFP